jgi:predicted transcriptional regulator
MEPSVLTLPDDCTAEDAAERVQQAEYERPKIFVLDRARQVKGAVSGQHLLRARGGDPVAKLLEPSEALWARETLAAAHERDIWEKESEVPVVNRMKEFVGVVSYADLRRGCRQLLAPASGDAPNADIGELAELFLAGLEGAWQSLGEIVRSEQSGVERRKT